jgi:hypothetical protein
MKEAKETATMKLQIREAMIHFLFPGEPVSVCMLESNDLLIFLFSEEAII